MASSCEKLDQLVKDYLLFRGFSATLKTLEQELKTDKDKGLRVDKMMELIWTLIERYDLSGLRDYWRYLNQRIFSRLDYRYAQSIQKLESSLLKLYLVNAHQCGKQDKVRSFFELLGPELQSHSDFKEWFAFPFVANPSENAMFSVHFTKQWQDTLQLTLHNFLSVVLQAMLPTLLNVEFDARRMKALQEENISLKYQLMNGAVHDEPVKTPRPVSRRSFQSELHPPTSPPDMVYDFSGLANEPEQAESEEAKQKSPRRFPFPSPLGSRKKSDATQIKPKTSNTAASSSSSATSNTEVRPKSREMSVFPPPSGGKTSGKKLSASSTSSSSIQSQAKQTQNSGFGTSSSSSHSPLPGRRQLSSTIVTTASTTVSSTPSGASIDQGSYSHTLAARSISAPEGKKSPSLKRMGGSTDSATVPRAPAANSGNENPGSEGPRHPVTGVGSGNIFPDISDPDSPFLLLEMDEYMEHGSSVCYCQFSPNGQHVASLDVDGVVKVWMWSPEPTTQATIMSRSAFLSLSWHHKWDRWLLLGNKSGSVRLFDVKESKTYREVDIHPDNPQNCMRVTDISSSPNGNHFVCATSNLCPFTFNPSSVSGKLFQWDLKTLKLDKALQVDSDICNAITCSCYTQSGQLITGGADGFVRIYDENKPKAAIKWPAHNSPIHTIQVRGKGDVYTMDNDGKLSQWNLSQPGQVVNTFYVGARQGQKSTFVGSPRGRLLSLDVSGHYLLTYKGVKGAIYKLEGQSAPSPVMELKAHQAPVMTVDWSPSQETFSSIPSQDTKHCLTGSADGRIKISTLLSK